MLSQEQKDDIKGCCLLAVLVAVILFMNVIANAI